MPGLETEQFLELVHQQKEIGVSGLQDGARHSSISRMPCLRRPRASSATGSLLAAAPTASNRASARLSRRASPGFIRTRTQVSRSWISPPLQVGYQSRLYQGGFARARAADQGDKTVAVELSEQGAGLLLAAEEVEAVLALEGTQAHKGVPESRVVAHHSTGQKTAIY